MLCFFSTGCRFCKLAARKISVIAKKADDDEVVNYVFAGAEVSVDKFFKETNSTVFQYSFLPPNRFLKITNGVMPLIILLQDGKVKGKYGYRDIREDELIRFLKE
jgi:thiol-disulfide isomerase/thioredoxin